MSKSAEVEAARKRGAAILALESTVISHGLPYPRNLETALEIERVVRAEHVIPATIGVIEGVPSVGLSREQLERLASPDERAVKLSTRDLPRALLSEALGGTTVAATMRIAHQAGIRVFSTGGIGGVHQGRTGDVSADLWELTRTRVAVVCAGAKAILDLPRTLEWLETHSVPVIGFGTHEFAAFYSSGSGLRASDRVDSIQEAVDLVEMHWRLGAAGVLIVNPVPAEFDIEPDEVGRWTDEAHRLAETANVTGPELTPFLLSSIAAISGGRALSTNRALLLSNARLGASLSKAVGGDTGGRSTRGS